MAQNHQDSVSRKGRVPSISTGKGNSAEEPLERYFLRYAYPCTFVKVTRGVMTEAEQQELEDAALGKRPVTRARLEEVYEYAFKRIREVAEEMGKPFWTKEVIREYYQNRHSALIDMRVDSWETMPGTLRDLCKIRTATIASVMHDVFIVTYAEQGRTQPRTVVSRLVPNGKVGDTVWIHYGWACEKAG